LGPQSLAVHAYFNPSTPSSYVIGFNLGIKGSVFKISFNKSAGSLSLPSGTSGSRCPVLQFKRIAFG